MIIFVSNLCNWKMMEDLNLYLISMIIDKYWFDLIWVSTKIEMGVLEGGGGSNDVKNENEGFDLFIKDLGKMWKDNELHNLK